MKKLKLFFVIYGMHMIYAITAKCQYIGPFFSPFPTVDGNASHISNTVLIIIGIALCLLSFILVFLVEYAGENKSFILKKMFQKIFQRKKLKHKK